MLLITWFGMASLSKGMYSSSEGLDGLSSKDTRSLFDTGSTGLDKFSYSPSNSKLVSIVGLISIGAGLVVINLLGPGPPPYFLALNLSLKVISFVSIGLDSIGIFSSSCSVCMGLCNLFVNVGGCVGRLKGFCGGCCMIVGLSPLMLYVIPGSKRFSVIAYEV